MSSTKQRQVKFIVYNVNETDTNDNNNTNIITNNKISNTLMINQVINKKTKRGRKSKNELPHYDKCAICLEYSHFSKEMFIQCEICKCNFHKSCYNKNLHINDTNKTCICERCFIARENNKDISQYK